MLRIQNIVKRIPAIHEKITIESHSTTTVLPIRDSKPGAEQQVGAKADTRSVDFSQISFAEQMKVRAASTRA